MDKEEGVKNMTSGYIYRKKKCPHCGHYLSIEAIKTVYDGEDMDSMNSDIKIEKYKRGN